MCANKTHPSAPLSVENISRLGLMAGGGRFPFILAQSAAELSIPVTVFAIKEITSPELEQYVDRVHWLTLGQFSKVIKLCHAEDIHHIVMGGRVPHNAIWRYRGFDKRTLRLLGKMVTRKADSILGAVTEELAQEDIRVVGQSLLLGGCMPKEGLLTPERPLTKSEKADVKFGYPLARKIAGMDIGQSIIVKDLAVVAVESLEGTDETILRGGKIAGGNVVLIKVAKPHQDSRFDIPVIGPGTIRTMKEAGGGVIAVMAGKTLFFDQDEAIAKAHEAGIGIVAIDPQD